MLWNKKYGDSKSGNEMLNDFVLDSDENIIATGYANYFNTETWGPTGGDALTFKINSLGDFLWENIDTTNPSFFDAGNSIVLDTNDNIYITGIREYGNGSSLLLIKYSKSGIVLWEKFSSSANSMYVGKKISIDEQQNLNILSINSYEDSIVDFTKRDFQGNLISSEGFNPSVTGDVLLSNSMLIDKNNSTYICGNTRNSALTNEIFIVGFNKNGHIFFQETFPSLDTLKSSLVKMVYAPDYSAIYLLLTVGNGNYDIYTIKYSLPKSTNVNYINKINEFEIYPNPTSNKLTIENKSPARIELSTINGQLLFSQSKTETTQTIDLSNYPNGIYFLKIIGADFSETRKIIKQ